MHVPYMCRNTLQNRYLYTEEYKGNICGQWVYEVLANNGSLLWKSCGTHKYTVEKK